VSVNYASGAAGFYPVSQKASTFNFSNNSANNQPILMIFGLLNPQKKMTRKSYSVCVLEQLERSSSSNVA